MLKSEAEYMNAAVKWNEETGQGLSISRLLKLVRRNDPILAKVISYRDDTGEIATARADARGAKK